MKKGGKQKKNEKDNEEMALAPLAKIYINQCRESLLHRGIFAE